MYEVSRGERFKYCWNLSGQHVEEASATGELIGGSFDGEINFVNF